MVELALLYQMKYDNLLAGLKTQLPNTKNILVILPSQLSVDKLAAGLSLHLALEQAGKQTTIVSEGVLQVGHSNLYGVGQVKQSLPQLGGGSLTLTLEGVVVSEGPQSGTVPALEKLDWYPEGQNLNLVFHVLPGQTFQPKNIVPKYSNSSFDLIFIIGANSFENIGKIYSENIQIFGNSQIVVVNNDPQSGQFGHFNILDTNSSTLSEMVAQIIPGLSLPMDGDSATNLLAGIYETTNNLTVNVKPDTLFAAGYAMQSGGRVPASAPQATSMEQQFSQTFSQSVLGGSGQQTMNSSYQTPTPPQPQVVESGHVTPITPNPEQFVVPQVAEVSPINSVVNVPSIQAHEEKPMGEFAVAGGGENLEGANPSPDWLTPKIYRGGGLG